MKKIILLFISIALFNFNSISQNSFGYFSLSGGVDTYSFQGDLNKSLSQSVWLSGIKNGFHIALEKRLNKTIGLSGTYITGKLEQFEITKNNQRNFQTPFHAIVLQGVVYTDNGKLFEPKNPFSLYLSSGFGYMQFTPYTDMYNSEGVRYYYWDDGTIRNMSQNAPNASSASVIKRDYNYETPIQDTASYTVSAQTFLLPVTIGLKYQLTPNIQSRIAASYYWTFTDDLDGYRAYNNYDRFFNLSVALHYTFGKIERRNKQYKHINFGEIYHEDSDGDGVEDATDKCQKTPIDVKVDADGCPLDEDEDGVPDYMDDEPHTPKGNPVNAHGVTITDEMFEQMALLRDSAVTTRTVTFYEKPTMDILRKIDQQIREHRKQMARIKAQTVLPEKFKFADENNDGIIQSNEIIAVIDGFLDGTYDISLDTVYELIDYFFEQ